MAAAWAICCFSSGCPGGRTSSGPALPAADSAAAAGGSAERPPEENKQAVRAQQIPASTSNLETVMNDREFWKERRDKYGDKCDPYFISI